MFGRQFPMPSFRPLLFEMRVSQCTVSSSLSSIRADVRSFLPGQFTMLAENIDHKPYKLATKL
jgi:hypothetical protein